MAVSDNARTISKSFVVPNELGLHARAASRLAKLTGRFRAAVHIHNDRDRVNGKSVLEVMTLGAEQGHALHFTVAGADAHQAMQAITGLFANNLGD